LLSSFPLFLYFFFVFSLYNHISHFTYYFYTDKIIIVKTCATSFNSKHIHI
jgi:hypothetical protein